MPARKIASILRKIASDYETQGSVLVVFNNDNQMSELNSRFMGKTGPTDVLAFNLAETGSDNYIEGEIYVDLQVAAKQATSFKVSYPEEVTRLCVHGLLHLLGFDDVNPPAKKKMWDIQEKYLVEFKIKGLHGH